MKVVCKIDNLYHIKDVDTLDRLKGYINSPDGGFGLVLGKEYTVYGVTFWDNAPLVYIFLDEGNDYPKPIAMDFFELSVGEISRCWRLSYFSQGIRESSSSLVFKEWAEDPTFYERLVEGSKDTVEVFNKYRLFMDSER
ncbi:hypothetical protein [Pseudomonas sp. 3JA]|uniref:hypothetical protein n=1 Tax=Pseudomonas sp. 3JA TaxID=3109347 RepID=UPI00300AD973